MRLNDLTGLKFNKLTVIKRIPKENAREAFWLCKCECGNTTIVSAQKLKSGHTKSCGCLNTRKKHGLHNSRLYKIWCNMKSRCYCESATAFDTYGGRGITVCDEWKSDFETFYKWAIDNGYNDALTIDRIDTNGNYEPSNCRWATMKEQTNNVRRNNRVEFNGVVHTVSEWSDITGINKKTLWNRLSRGWPIEKALTKKVGE